MPGEREARRRVFLPRDGLGELVALLRGEGYSVIGPRRDGAAVVLGEIASVGDLARGVRDEQRGGSYRLVEGDGELTFEYVVGMNSAKTFFFPAVQRMYRYRAEGGAFVIDAGPPQARKLAMLGIRPCDLAALRVLDRAFGVGEPGAVRCTGEDLYGETRRRAFLAVVNCTHPAGTCFCGSMGTGPAAEGGYDLCLTELRAGFVAEADSDAGRRLLERLPVREPTSAEVVLAELKLANAREHMGRRLDVAGLKEILDGAVEHPRWDEVAKRCLSCGNCTLVCPTCFCSTVAEQTEVGAPEVTRWRQWESCHWHQFSYTTAGPVRSTVRGRYRHWMRHKLCTWFDQFGCSGCVGCGRCITWCPVGIDLTEEAAAIRESLVPAKPEVAA